MNRINRLIDRAIEDKKVNFFLFCCTLLFLTAYMLYINNPIYAGDDFTHHYGRLQGLINALRDGTFPWYINYNGLSASGYFVKAFYADLTLLPFAIIGLFTNTVVAYYSIIIGTTWLCALTTYYCVHRVYKNVFVASISSILYTFCAYRLLDLYFRAAIGEVFTFIFLPIVFLGMYEIIKGEYKKWYILAFGYTLIIYSHLISSVMLVVPLVLFLIIYYKDLVREPKRFYWLIVVAIVTVLLTVFYTLPMLEQMLSNTFYYETRSSIPEVMQATRSVSTILDGFFQGSFSHLQGFTIKTGVILTMAMATRLLIKRGQSKSVRSADWLVFGGFVCLFLISDLFYWGLFPFSLLNVIQYPWRFFIFPSLFFAIAGSIYISELNISNRRLFIIYACFIVASAVVIKAEGQAYTWHIGTEKKGPTLEMISQTEMYSYGACEYMPDKVPGIADLLYTRKGVAKAKNEDTQISNYTNEAGIISFDIVPADNEILELGIIYYKGYTVEQNGNVLPHEQSAEGLIDIRINEAGTVKVYYAGTRVQKLATVASLLSFVALCVYIFVMHRRNRRVGAGK